MDVHAAKVYSLYHRCAIAPLAASGRYAEQTRTHSGFCSLPLAQTLCSLDERRVLREAPQGRPLKPVVNYG